MAIRNEGNWEGWLKFFLKGIYEVSLSSTETARQILHLRESHREILSQQKLGANAHVLLDYLYERPLLTIKSVEVRLGCAYITASKLIEQFETLGLLKEITGGQRSREYQYEPYLALFGYPELSIEPELNSDRTRMDENRLQTRG